MPSLTPRCSSYWKGSLLVTLDYGRQLSSSSMLISTEFLYVSICLAKLSSWVFLKFFFTENQVVSFCKLFVSLILLYISIKYFFYIYILWLTQISFSFYHQSYYFNLLFFLVSPFLCVCVCVCVCMYIYIYIYIHTHTQTYIHTYTCPVGWGCRIHRLLLCRGVRPPQRVSWIWH